MTEIKEASSVSDFEFIRQIAIKTWWKTYPDIIEEAQIQYSLSTIYSRESIESAVKKGEKFLLLFNSGFANGFASYIVWAERQSVWKLNKLYVLPEAQGNGFGKKLVDEVAKRASSSGIRSLVLNVHRKNPAIAFYGGLGFEILREEDIPIGPYWMNDYVMELRLD